MIVTPEFSPIMQIFLCIIQYLHYNLLMQNESTRDKLIEHLRIERVATATQIAEALKLSGADVRYHLTRLKKAGLIESHKDTRQLSPGRPALVYCLSADTQPHFLGGLACLLLESRLNQNSPETEDETWAALANQFGLLPPETRLQARHLTQAMRRLNQMNYKPRWEAAASGPRILFGNCPYAAIWSRFPGLCKMDRFLLENWTGRSLRQTARINFTERKPAACIFEIDPGM